MINVAIIGTGAISDAHIQAYLKFKELCRIVAMVDIYPDKATAKAQKYGLDVNIYDQPNALLNNESIDLASICVPPFAHAQTTIDVLNAGINALVEKPMATCLQECDRMIAAAEDNDRLLSIVAQNRYKTPLMNLKHVLDAGLLGKIIHAQVDSFWWRGANYYDLWWRGTWEKEGGGCTMNHAVHHIDLFQWYAGMPSEVQAVVTNLAHENSEVEDFSTAVMFFDDGSLGQVTASLVHHGEQQQVTIQGERAMVSIPWAVRASRQMENGFPEEDPGTEAEINSYFENLPDLEFINHDGQIANMLAAIVGEQELLIDGKEGRKTVELVSAIYQSGISGKRVKLPLTSADAFYTREGILNSAPHFHEKTHSVDNFESDQITFGRDF